MAPKLSFGTDPAPATGAVAAGVAGAVVAGGAC